MKQELPSYQNKIIRSFGRIKSRKLSPAKQDLIKNFLPQFLFDEENLLKKFSQLKHQKNILEIGFGFGDFLNNLIQNNPHKNFFGFEPHINGVVHFLGLIKDKKTPFLKICCDDVRHKIKIFPEDFFEEIYLLFPDPWPKSKHFKRRIINQKFLDETLALKLKKDGKLIIATDHNSYKTWILAHILQSKKLIWTAQSKQDWQNFPDSWYKTKYQNKALAQGRQSVIFELKKI